MNKKKQKVNRKHSAHRKMGNKAKPASTTSSNWDMTVLLATTTPEQKNEPETNSLLENSSEETVRGGFTPGEIGQIAPLDQEGEGNRQNAEAQELEQIEPDDR